MNRIISAIITVCILISCFCHVYAKADGIENTEETVYGVLYDDCTDFSVSYAHSDGVYADITPEEDRYAFDDYTTFMRKESTAEWVEYRLPVDSYLVLHTYFKENEEISHFKFSWSADGDTWQEFTPITEVKQVESWKWIPVIYNLKKVDSTAEYIRVTFGNIGGMVTSPRIAGVYTRPVNADETGFSDCVGTEYYESTAVLKNLNIVSGTDGSRYEPQRAVTRAEFAALTANLLDISNGADKPEYPFADVDGDCEFAAAIKTLYDMGILHGAEDGLFYPNNTVTYAEAVKILVSAFGYTDAAEDGGGYPTGYMLMSSRLGMSDGISAKADTEITRGAAAKLIYNSLDAELAQQIKYGADKTYERSGNTVLEYYHGITKISGVLSDVGALSAVGGRKLSDDTAVIDDIKLKFDSFNPKKLFAQTVTAYVRYSNDKTDGKLIYAIADSGNKVTDISYADYDEIRDSRIVYTDADGRECKAAFSDNTRVIYNGRYLTRMGLETDLKFSCGFLRLITYPDSASANVILINDYKTYTAPSDGYLNSNLTDFDGRTYTLGFDAADMITVNRYGEAVEYNDKLSVQKDDIINAAVSDDGSCIDVYIINQRIYGNLDSVSEADKTCKIDGKTYKLTGAAVNNADSMLGKNVAAYLDVNDSITLIKKQDGSQSYGYLLSAPHTNAFSGSAEMRILAADGTVRVINADLTTKLNGQKAALGRFGEIAPQLIRYTLRDDGSVSLIELAGVSASVGGSVFTENYSAQSCKYYGGNLKTFASAYQLNESTPIFVIPDDTYDADKLRVKNLGYLINDKSYSVRLYDTDDSYMVGAAVIYSDKSEKRELEYSDRVAVVTDAANISDKNGKRCIDLSVLLDGQESHIFFDNDGGEDVTGSWLPNHKGFVTKNGNIEFKKGDVLQFYMDDESHCKYFRMLLTRNVINNDLQYERNLGDYGALTNENYFSELYSCFGTAEKRYGNKLMVSVGGGVLRTIPLGGVKVYIYDTVRDKLSGGDLADISTGSKVFVRMNFTETKEIIVIK